MITCLTNATHRIGTYCRDAATYTGATFKSAASFAKDTCSSAYSLGKSAYNTTYHAFCTRDGREGMYETIFTPEGRSWALQRGKTTATEKLKTIFNSCAALQCDKMHRQVSVLLNKKGRKLLNWKRLESCCNLTNHIHSAALGILITFSLAYLFDPVNAKKAIETIPSFIHNAAALTAIIDLGKTIVIDGYAHLRNTANKQLKLPHQKLKNYHDLFSTEDQGRLVTITILASTMLTYALSHTLIGDSSITNINLPWVSKFHIGHLGLKSMKHCIETQDISKPSLTLAALTVASYIYSEDAKNNSNITFIDTSTVRFMT